MRAAAKDSGFAAVSTFMEEMVPLLRPALVLRPGVHRAQPASTPPGYPPELCCKQIRLAEGSPSLVNHLRVNRLGIRRSRFEPMAERANAKGPTECAGPFCLNSTTLMITNGP